MPAIPTAGATGVLLNIINRINDQVDNWSFSTQLRTYASDDDLPNPTAYRSRPVLVLDHGGSPAIAIPVAGVWRFSTLT